MTLELDTTWATRPLPLDAAAMERMQAVLRDTLGFSWIKERRAWGDARHTVAAAENRWRTEMLAPTALALRIAYGDVDGRRVMARLEMRMCEWADAQIARGRGVR